MHVSPPTICLLWECSHLAVDAGRFATRTSWGVAKPSPIFSRKFIELVAIPASRIDYLGDRLDNNIIPVRDVGLAVIFIEARALGPAHVRRPEIAMATPHAPRRLRSAQRVCRPSYPATRAGRC